ncbi:MAG: CvpA family protein [bacterium]
MNILDFFIIILIIIGGIFGWRKGLFLTMSYVVGGILGCWAGSNYYALPGRFFPFLRDYMAISYFLTFICVFFLVIAIGLIIRKLLKIMYIDFIDKIIGLPAGVFLSFCIIGSILIPINLAKITFIKKSVNESVLAPGILQATKRIIKILPPRRKKLFEHTIVKKVKPVVDGVEQKYYTPVKKYIKRNKNIN